jgi:hypothetical protein
MDGFNLTSPPPYVENFLKRFSKIDLLARAHDAEVNPKNYNEFVDAYKSALLNFYSNSGGTYRPPRQDALRQLKRIEKAAATLRNELDTIFDINEGIWCFLDEAYMINEPENVDDIVTGEFEGISYGDYELQLLIDRTTFLMEMTTEAYDLIPKTKRGKPKKNEAAEELVRQLANIYEKSTGKSASKGCYHNGTTDQYEGKFILFVENSLVHFQQCPPLTNNAVGEIIRRALGAR